MYKDIRIKYSRDFAHYTNIVLVSGDVNAYRINFETPWQLDGCTFKVTCIRADGVTVTDMGEASGNTAMYTVSNSMYSVAGDITFQLTLIDGSETVFTACEISAYVVKGNSEGIQAENLTPILDSVLINVSKISTALEEHKADKSNPHSVTKSQVGLGNVDNVKQAAKADFDAHTSAAVLDHPDGSVTEDKIADGAVTENKILSGAVTADKIADSAVTGSKIAESSIEETHLKEDVKKMLIPTIKITDSDSSGSIYKSLLIYEYDGGAPIIPMVLIDDDTVGWMYTGDAHAGVFRVVYTNGSRHIEGILEQVFDDNNNFIQILTVGTAKKYRNLGTLTAGSEVYPPASWSDIITTAVDGAAIKDGTVSSSKIATGAITYSKMADKAVSEAALDTELSKKINGKADKGTKLSDYGIADAYTKSETDTKLDKKANVDNVYTKTQSDSKLDTKENAANKVTAISDTSTDEQYPSAKAVNDTVKVAKEAASNTFANVLKGKSSAENAVRIDDSSPVEHEMSVRVSSKNLIPYPYTGATTFPKTVNGITFTCDDNGWITANGTATAISQLFISTTGGTPIDMNKTYIVSGCPANGSVDTYKTELLLYNNGTYIGNFIDTGSGKVVKYNSKYMPYNECKYKIYIAKGTVVDNLVFKPQLELGTTATEWTAYVSPSAVNVKSYGKNLIPYPYYDTTKTVCGVTFTDNGDGSITVSGTATSYASFTMCGALSPLPLTVVPGTTYTFSSLAVSAENIVYSITERNNQEQITTYTCEPNKNFTFTVSENTTALSIIIKRKNDGIECKGTFCHHMLELGTSATEYENYVEPAVYTPQADGKVSGVKNIYPTTTLLCDTDGVVIDVEYNRDINKAFEELKNAILSQGGNV